MYGRFNWLVRAVCLVWCCLFAFQVSAASSPPYIKTKYGYAKKINGGGTWSAVRTDYLIETGNIPEGATIPRNKQISVVYPKQDVIAKGKQFKKASPFNLAVIAAVEAAGWAIDELSGQITKPQEIIVGKYRYRLEAWAFGPATELFDDIDQAVAQAGETYNAESWGRKFEFRKMAPNVGEPTRFNGSGCGNAGSIPYNTILDGVEIGPGMYAVPITACRTSGEGNTETRWYPVSSSEEDSVIDEAVRRASERQLKPLFSDPYSNPYNWPPFWDSLRDWMRDVADRDPNDNVTYDPVNNRWVIGSPSGGPDVNIEVKPVPDPTAPDFDPTESPGDSTAEGGQFELPAFCDWATVVCEWLEWTKEEPEEMEPDELPVDELTAADFKRDYSSGLGSGSCPAPVSFTLQGQTAQFSYENACWAAESLFKPVLLTIAGIMAAFIIVGASRRAV